MEEQTPAVPSQPARRRDIPLWIGVTLIALGLGAGAWFVYGQIADYIAGKPHSFVIKGVNAADYVNIRPTTPVRAPTGGRRGMGGMANMGDEVRAIGTDSIRVRAGAMMINIRYSGGTMTMAGSLLNAAVLHPDYTITQLLKSRIKGDALTSLGLSDAQKELLQKVQGSPMTYPIRFDESETAALKPLVEAWRSAPENAKASPAGALIGAIRKLLPGKTAAAKTAASDEVSAFRKSVNDDTWQKIRQAVTGGGN